MRARHSALIKAILLGGVVLVGAIVFVAVPSKARPALYTFRDLPPDLASKQVNLLADPSFENANTPICTAQCSSLRQWTVEHYTPSAPTVYRSRVGAVTGRYAETLIYKGERGDNGIHKDVELFQGVATPQTRAGRRLTFTLWVSGTCVKCAPFIGIEAFDARQRYLGESDQYFRPPSRPKPVQVSYLLPAGAVAVAAYIQVPELYAVSKVDLHVDDASLTASPTPTSTSPWPTKPQTD